MKYFGPYLLLACILLYLLTHHAQTFGWGSWVFRFYIKDVLIVPVLLSAVGIAMSVLKKDFDPGKKEVWIAVIYVTLAFEILMPIFGTNIEFDPFDVICYAIGGFVYYVFLRDVHRLKPKLTTC
jgi:hypothetical protein